MTGPATAALAAALAALPLEASRYGREADAEAIIAALAAQGWHLYADAAIARAASNLDDAAVRDTLEGLRAEVAVLPEASFGAIWRGAALDAIDARLAALDA